MHWPDLFSHRRKNAELEEELRAHLRMAIQDRMDRGESPEHARSAALREFGNVALIEQTTRDVWGWTAVAQTWQDLRCALRVLLKSPASSAAAVVLIALGIGVNATIYSLVRTLLTKPMPGVQADRLVSIGVLHNGQMDDPGDTYVNYREYLAESQTLRPILARGFGRFTLTLEKVTYGLRGQRVSANYFDTVGVRLVRGRPFADKESADASGLVVVISYLLWQDQFHAAEDVIGLPVILNGKPAKVVGVAPRGFRGLQLGEHVDLWVPLVSYARATGTLRELQDPTNRSFEMIGRLAPGVSLAAARAEFDSLSRRLQAAFPEANRNKMALLVPYSALGPGIQSVRVFLRIFMGVAVLTLLIVCANVANLILARSVARQRELAVRQSIGASRSRIVRMLLAEGLVLSAAACMAAWALAQWASRALPRVLPGRGAPVDLDFAPDWHVAGYALALAVFGTLAFTLAPALRAWRQELLPWLKAGEHSVVAGRSKLAAVLVVVQLALCVVLLTAAGLANRSLYLLDSPDLHLGQNRLLLVGLNTVGAASGTPQNLLLLDRLRDRLRALPGVIVASYARAVPPNGWQADRIRTNLSEPPLHVDTNLVGPAYLSSVGLTPLAGRGIEDTDRAGSKPIAVINQDLAESFWPGQSPLGRIIFLGSARRPAEIVGIVPNSVFTGFREGIRHNTLFLPETQGHAGPGEITLHLLCARNPETIVPALRAAIRDTDFRVAINSLQTGEAFLSEFTAPVLFLATLLGIFAVAALLLAAIGLYAVIAFNMSRRTRDFGIRMALGASSGQILATVLREGLLLTSIGLVCGFALALACTRSFRSVMVGVTPTDLPTWLGVFALLAAVSLLACYLPARRAARINPTEALRQE